MTSPVQIHNLTLHNRDCMEVMAEYPDKHFDLAIVDPPYGIGVNHNMGRRKGDAPSGYKPAVWDEAPPDADYFKELFRVSKNQIVWGANHFIDLIARPSPCWLVWDKLFSEDVSFASVELAWTSFDSVSKKFQCSSQDPNRIHPTQKPQFLYNWIISRYAQPGQLILSLATYRLSLYWSWLCQWSMGRTSLLVALPIALYSYEHSVWPALVRIVGDVTLFGMALSGVVVLVEKLKLGKIEIKCKKPIQNRFI